MRLGLAAFDVSFFSAVGGFCRDMLLLRFPMTYVGWSRPMTGGAPDVRRMGRADGVDMAP